MTSTDKAKRLLLCALALLCCSTAAKAAAAAGEAKTILFNLSGHGFLDLAAYEMFNKGELVDYDYATDTVIK